MDKDERLIADFLSKKGLHAAPFSKQERQHLKTPDYSIYKGTNLAFFCEVKTVLRDEWLDHQLDTAPPGSIIGGGRSDPVLNRLTSKIHEAVQQFDVINPYLICPNVLAFVNHDQNSDLHDLVGVITGQFLANGRGLCPIYYRFSEGRIRSEKFRVHLYIWLDEFWGNFYLFNNYAVDHLGRLCEYFGIDRASIKNLL